MDRMINVHQSAGLAAAAARVLVSSNMATRPAQHGLGYGWLTIANPCVNVPNIVASNGFALDMAATAPKRQPRRLGTRTT